MEQQPTIEKTDPWRKAILVERKETKQINIMLKKVLSNYEGPRRNALVLGDASLVQSKFLLEEEAFEHVVDVDSSPSLMDDEVVSIEDKRLERVLSEFDAYELPVDTFDLVYGKSIAFNPKSTIENVLKNISLSLTGNGIFYAEFAGEGDSYRHRIEYGWQEIKSLYTNAQLKILENVEIDEQKIGLLGRPGRVHVFKIVAKRF